MNHFLGALPWSGDPTGAHPQLQLNIFASKSQSLTGEKWSSLLLSASRAVSKQRRNADGFPVHAIATRQQYASFYFEEVTPQTWAGSSFARNRVDLSKLLEAVLAVRIPPGRGNS